MLERLAKLIDVKSIVTLVSLAVFAYLNISGQEVSDGFMNIYTVIIAFYFGTQASKVAESISQDK